MGTNQDSSAWCAELPAPGGVSPSGMARKLCTCTAVAALGLAAPAWAASPLNEYQQSGHITPCRYSPGQLEGSVPNDVAQYAPEYASALQAAARERAGGCGGAAAAAAGGSAGQGADSAGGPGSGGGGASNSEAAGAGAGAAAVAARAQRAHRRARARRRALSRARARLTAAKPAPVPIAADARVPARALLIAALPILLLLAIGGAVRGREALARRRGTGIGPVRSGGGAIVLPPPTVRAPDDDEPGGNGHGNGSPAGTTAESATEEMDAVEPARGRYPPATSRRRNTR